MYPILFSLGPIKIYSFGVFLALAALVASFVIWREGRNQKFPEEKLVDLLIFEAVFGLVGARLYYLLSHFGDFAGLNPLYWLLVFHFPGLAFMGAILGGIIGLQIFSQRNGWGFWQTADFLVLGLSLGEAIARLGAFFSGSAYGSLTLLPWGVTMVGLLGKRHPVQLYESLIAFLIFIILLKLKNYFAAKNLVGGLTFLAYLIFLGISKFFLEFFHGQVVYFNGWRLAQIVNLVIVGLALIFFYRRLGRSLKADFQQALSRFKRKENVNL